MRKVWPALLITLAVVPATVAAQDATQAGAARVMVEAGVGTAVADRQLTGSAESFPVSAGTLYCYMKISNAADTQIEHVWYKGEAEMARVKLNVGGSPWRTWSSKKVTEDAAGDWRCDIVQDGAVLKSVKFKIE